MVWSGMAGVTRDLLRTPSSSILHRLSSKFQPLSDGQSTLVAGVLRGDVNDANVFVNLPGYFDIDSLYCLKPRAWLNDEVIDEYMRILDARRPDAYRLMGSLVWKKLSVFGFEGIRKWAVVKSIKVEGLKAVLFPCNVNDSHWRLCIVHFTTKRLEVWDTMGSQDVTVVDKANFSTMKAFVAGMGCVYVFMCLCAC
jgi:sentrin-specific protease 1